MCHISVGQTQTSKGFRTQAALGDKLETVGMDDGF
jgi:hypothetical protein